MSSPFEGRYANLPRVLVSVAARKSEDPDPLLRFCEIGTYNGHRAAAVLARWHAGGEGRRSHYYGFDLFEALTPELSRQELSKAKPPPSRADVRRQMEARLRPLGVDFAVDLFAGNTRDTLPRMLPLLPEMDLIFVDGGHSLETVASDWNAIAPALKFGTIVLFDDYYMNRLDFGCGPRLTSLDPERYEVTLLDPVDFVESSGLKIRMACVELRGP